MTSFLSRPYSFSRPNFPTLERVAAYSHRSETMLRLVPESLSRSTDDETTVSM